ncbi:hypothetical protein H9P43_005696 [Blastocladiella emersonii ATCC 22665]|nr:hypothetical protein H9P43_005696 [Blastocladiella emersonii ATCC 22665]
MSAMSSHVFATAIRAPSEALIRSISRIVAPATIDTDVEASQPLARNDSNERGDGVQQSADTIETIPQAPGASSYQPSQLELPDRVTLATPYAERPGSSAVSLTPSALLSTSLIDVPAIRVKLDTGPDRDGALAMGRVIYGSAIELFSGRNRPPFSLWTLIFERKSIESKYADSRTRASNSIILIMTWAMFPILSVRFILHLATHNRYGDVLAACPAIGGSCDTCQLVVYIAYYLVGLFHALVLLSMFVPPRIISAARRRSFFIAFTLIAFALETASAMCPTACYRVADGTTLSPGREFAALCPNNGNAVELDALLRFWMTNTSISFYFFIGASSVMFHRSLPVGAVLVLVVLTAGFSLNHSPESWVWLYAFNLLDNLFKGAYGLYQRDFLSRITFFLNVQQAAQTAQSQRMTAAHLPSTARLPPPSSEVGLPDPLARNEDSAPRGPNATAVSLLADPSTSALGAGLVVSVDRQSSIMTAGGFTVTPPTMNGPTILIDPSSPNPSVSRDMSSSSTSPVSSRPGSIASARSNPSSMPDGPRSRSNSITHGSRVHISRLPGDSAGNADVAVHVVRSASSGHLVDGVHVSQLGGLYDRGGPGGEGGGGRGQLGVAPLIEVSLESEIAANISSLDLMTLPRKFRGSLVTISRSAANLTDSSPLSSKEDDNIAVANANVAGSLKTIKQRSEPTLPASGPGLLFTPASGAPWNPQRAAGPGAVRLGGPGGATGTAASGPGGGFGMHPAIWARWLEQKAASASASAQPAPRPPVVDPTETGSSTLPSANTTSPQLTSMRSDPTDSTLFSPATTLGTAGASNSGHREERHRQRQRALARRSPFVRRFLRTMYRLRSELFYKFPDPVYEDEYLRYYYGKLLRRMRITALCGMISQVLIGIILGAIRMGFRSGVSGTVDVVKFAQEFPLVALISPSATQWWFAYAKGIALNLVHLAVGAAAAFVPALRGPLLEWYLIAHSMLYVCTIIILDTVMQAVTSTFVLTQSTRHQVLATIFSITTLRLRPRAHLLVMATLVAAEIAQSMRLRDIMSDSYHEIELYLSACVVAALMLVSTVLCLFFETGTRRYFMLRRVVH